MSKVAVVTGSNKGIGFAIVRGLCKKFDGDVYLTARDVSRGEEAVKELEKEGIKPKFHQLDITNKESIAALKKFLVHKYGGLDLLVNNAAIAYKMASTVPFSDQAEESCKVNFWATLDVCNSLFPILRSHARVVHVSSFGSVMALNGCSSELQEKLKSCKTIKEIGDYMTTFVGNAKEGDVRSFGWAQSAYGVSKVGVTVMTPIQQAEFDKDPNREDIVVNAVCPGYVATDMSSFKGTKTIDQGAETPLYTALLPPGIATPRGEFLSDKQVHHWR